MLVKEFLDSDRVNFLVWRYLLEGNYRETAAKFQKEWNVRAPHQHFDFAPHIKSHALVSIINRGLLYHALERQRASSQLPEDVAAETEALQVGIFGPLNAAQPPAKVEDHGAAVTETATATTSAPASAASTSLPALVTPADDADNSRKRSQQQLPNGSPVKRPRLSNSCDSGHDAPATATTTPMDIDPQDQHQDNHAYPSPLEGEETATPVVQTEGPERGTQPEKTEELTPHTTFIRLTDDERTTTTDVPPPASPGPDASADAPNAPTLLHCQWSPKDPSALAASGTGALARVWSVSRVPASDTEPAQDHVASKAIPLVPAETSQNTIISQLAWASDGSTIAVVAETEGQAATVNVFASDGVLLQSFESPVEQVIKLSWNPSNTALLTISPSTDDSSAVVAIHNATSGTSLSYSFPGHDLNAAPLDASWTSDAEFLVCGGDILMSLHCSDTSIAQVRKFETKADDSFRNVLFDWRSKLAATSSEKGTLDLWDETGQRRSISAHQGAITTMEWQPLPPMHPNVDDERLIATGGEDCAILIWNARVPEAKARCFLTMDSPIMRLAFTPDGAFIAGATATQVLIWKVDNPIAPRAVWKRTEHPGWLSPKPHSDEEEEGYAEHCLCWDSNGQKLAYGANSRLAVINWSR